MSKLPILPQELLDAIIDTFTHDRSTLKLCSLASRSLLPRSQSHLFHTIRLEEPRSCARLHIVLMRNPGLAVHIHELTLGIFSNMKQVFTWLGGGDIDTPLLLPRVLDMLTSLRTFTFDVDHQLVWRDIHTDISAALFRLFTRPGLLSIRLMDLHGVPVAFFDVPAKLECLELRDVTFEEVVSDDDFDFDSDGAAASGSFLSFESLEFDGGTRAPLAKEREVLVEAISSRRRRHGDSYSSFSRLTDLCIHPSRVNFAITLPILHTAAHSLTSLKLVHEYRKYFDRNGRDLPAFQFPLSSIPNLRSLALTFIVHYTASEDIHNTCRTVVSHLLVFLTSNANASTIETLTITIKPTPSHIMFTPKITQLAWALSQIEGWGDIDDALSSSPHPHTHPRPLQVTLTLSLLILTRKELSDTRGEWRRWMGTRMVRMREAGMLVLEVESFLEGFPVEEWGEDERRGEVEAGGGRR
ncbi:hypothetical protein Hypma_003127 [Hypsizygus marmoreus]|uniref:F-box domain-containing protein n=1 Tax=Hypsizygus marmoreus TaxID=39966 RepID=A0A369J711_HYPMA|nr:hypothetical protein Hypma_003127 [Hypsizygus marmoreus]